MGATREATEQVSHSLIDEGGAANSFLESLQLGLARQFAVENEVSGLEEGGLLGELLNGVAAIAQNALLAVDVGDLRLAGRRVDESGVDHDVAGLVEQTPDAVTDLAVSGDNLAEIELGVFVDKPCTRTHRAILPGGRVRTSPVAGYTWTGGTTGSFPSVTTV